MEKWKVTAEGVRVVVRSPDGDVFPFIIGDRAHDHLEMQEPIWKGGQSPQGADFLIGEARQRAIDHARKTFGKTSP